MNTTQNVLQECFGGASEYNKPLNSADQISGFEETAKELSKEELLGDLTFTMQSNQEQEEQPTGEKNFTHQPANNQGAGLW